MAMASTVRLKATQVTGRPITWAQINLAASEDLRGLMRRNRWAAELVLAFIERMEPGGGCGRSQPPNHARNTRLLNAYCRAGVAHHHQ